MTQPRRICAVTGSRADYGLLAPVLRAINEAPSLALHLAVTGMHLSAKLGSTYREIEADGFSIAARVDMLQADDSAVGIGTSIGRGVIGFAGLFDRLRPDLVLLVGDRYETLAAAQAALVARIPIAHIGGGEVTEGVYDEAWRHALTKMAHLHFVMTEEAARRVRQLGEDAARVFTVGNPGLDAIRQLKLLGREDVERATGFALRPRNLLVTFHPATLDATPAEEQLGELLTALDRLGPDVGILFTHPTADRGHRALVGMVEAWVAERAHARAYASLGHALYLSSMALVDVVVGNSSSGCCEAPSFRKPAVNIGDRQKGRLSAASVIDCAPLAAPIEAAIRRAFDLDCANVVNPYGDGESAGRIVAVLRDLPATQTLLKKRFVDRA